MSWVQALLPWLTARACGMGPSPLTSPWYLADTRQSLRTAVDNQPHGRATLPTWTAAINPWHLRLQNRGLPSSAQSHPDMETILA